MHERGTTIRLPEDLLAEARSAADRHGSFNRFVAWTIRQALRLEFLSPKNREFVLKVAGELGQPWNALTVLNLLAGYARGDARARKLIDLFFADNDSLRVNAAHCEPQGNPVDQIAINFSQKQQPVAPERPLPGASGVDAAAGEEGPSPRKAEPSPAHPVLAARAQAKGAARG